MQWPNGSNQTWSNNKQLNEYGRNIFGDLESEIDTIYAPLAVDNKLLHPQVQSHAVLTDPIWFDQNDKSYYRNSCQTELGYYLT